MSVEREIDLTDVAAFQSDLEAESSAEGCGGASCSSGGGSGGCNGGSCGGGGTGGGSSK